MCGVIGDSRISVLLALEVPVLAQAPASVSVSVSAFALALALDLVVSARAVPTASRPSPAPCPAHRHLRAPEVVPAPLSLSPRRGALLGGGSTAPLGGRDRGCGATGFAALSRSSHADQAHVLQHWGCRGEGSEAQRLSSRQPYRCLWTRKVSLDVRESQPSFSEKWQLQARKLKLL